MPDEIALQRDISRAARAEALLRDDLLTEAFDGLEAVYFDAWKASPPRDTEGRERLWQAAQIAGKVREHLKSIASHGKLAQRELDDLARMAERSKVLGIF